MWIDYWIYLSGAISLLGVIGLGAAIGWGKGGRRIRLVLVLLVVTFGIVSYAVRPENFRSLEPGVLVAEIKGGFVTQVGWVGQCLSLYRTVGPVSFIVGSDLFPGGTWDRRPVSSCEAMGVNGPISLPDEVRDGRWMLCDYSHCYPLVRA